MDRMVLESDPHRVLEGLAIAAYAVGAAEGFFYIRAEYPLAVQRIREAIRRCASAGISRRPRPRVGLLACDLEVREGAGAFVCGEETALIVSLEGRRGMPRLRPPYPAERGFRGQPTLINNVETLAVRAVDHPPRRRTRSPRSARARARARRSSRSPARSTAAG